MPKYAAWSATSPAFRAAQAHRHTHTFIVGPDGHILRVLRRAGHTVGRSLTNDVLVATSAVQIGATVVQDNEKDFAAIQRAFPLVSFTGPWPTATGAEGE